MIFIVTNKYNCQIVLIFILKKTSTGTTWEVGTNLGKEN